MKEEKLINTSIGLNTKKLFRKNIIKSYEKKIKKFNLNLFKINEVIKQKNMNSCKLINASNLSKSIKTIKLKPDILNLPASPKIYGNKSTTAIKNKNKNNIGINSSPRLLTIKINRAKDNTKGKFFLAPLNSTNLYTEYKEPIEYKRNYYVTNYRRNNTIENDSHSLDKKVQFFTNEKLKTLKSLYDVNVKKKCSDLRKEILRQKDQFYKIFLDYNKQIIEESVKIKYYDVKNKRIKKPYSNNLVIYNYKNK